MHTVNNPEIEMLNSNQSFAELLRKPRTLENDNRYGNINHGY